MENLDFIDGTAMMIAIPLSKIRNHIEYYGGYGIWLSKSWGIDKGIDPVAYSIPGSLAMK